MPMQLNIKQFISLLNQGRDTIDLLFGEKDSVPKEELLNSTRPELFDKLVLHQVIRINDHNNAVLDDRLVTFFEEFLEIGEVNIGTINDSIESLTQNINYYKHDKRYKYIKNVKKILRKIVFTTSREIIKLDKIIDDTYKNEENYYNKLTKLENYRVKRDDILKLIQETERILNSERVFFHTSPDNELQAIEQGVRITLLENKDFLNEIQAQIIDYLNRIQIKPDVYKHIQKLKELKDNAELKYKTNLLEVVSAQDSLLFQQKMPFRGRVPLSFLETDEGKQIVRRIAEKIKIVEEPVSVPVKQLSKDFDKHKEVQTSRINISNFLTLFSKSKTDLFTFITQFKFPNNIGKMTFENRLTLFVEISIDHDTELKFSDNMQYTDYTNENGQVSKLGYAVIYPKKAKK